MAFAKLDSGIINSSIWSEPLATRVLWITILALKDENGFVGAARSGLKRAANITDEEFGIAIKSLESPDLESRTPDYDGRRVEKIEGGWVVLNHEKYKVREDIKREYMRSYMKAYRDSKVNSKTNNVNSKDVKDTSILPSVSVSVSNSISKLNKEGECEGEKIEPTETGIVKSEKKVLYVPPWTTPEMQQKWVEWVKYRKEIKKPYKTDRGPRGTETDLRGIAGDDESLMVLILKQSMDREWTGVFALKNPPVSNQYSTPGHPVFAGDEE